MSVGKFKDLWALVLRIWRRIVRWLYVGDAPKPTGHVYLLNKANVVNEVMVRNRYRIAQVLKVEPKHVTARWILVGNTPKPEFIIDMGECDGITEAEVKEVMQTIYLNFKEELSTRLYGLRQRRDG